MLLPAALRRHQRLRVDARKAAKVAKQGDSAFDRPAWSVGAANRSVRWSSTTVISDVNGSAVVAC